MKKRGEAGGQIYETVTYLILLVIFFVGMLYFVLQQQSGAGIWEQYYAKELVKIIDFSKPGDALILDVQRGSEIAKKNGVLSFSTMFVFDNAAHEVCVKLNTGGKRTCHNYFNDADVAEVQLQLAGGKNAEGMDVNVLSFKIVDRQRRDLGGERV